MKSILKSIVIGAAMAVGVAGVVFAESPDPVVGTWNLNLSKSTFKPGPALKSQTRVYTESPDGTSLTTTSTDASGKESTVMLTFKYDGKSHPATGSADYDAVVVTRVNALTVHSQQFKAGKPVGKAERLLSKDGKTLTFKQHGTHASGVKYEDVLVYDKQ
jgi:hypothetical protein